MKKLKILGSIILLLFAIASLTSCETEDPGPFQETEKRYSVVDFDRLEMGDALQITVEQSSFFEISVRGDRRNVDDLSVRREGSTLVIEFDENRNRIHETFVAIKMPMLYAANFSGATDSRISGFTELTALDLIVSGASVCQVDLNATNIDAVVSGASYLNLTGSGEKLIAEVTGASILKSFSYPVNEANILVSGASVGRVNVNTSLAVNASGASEVTYRGNPSVSSEVSGGSTVRKD